MKIIDAHAHINTAENFPVYLNEIEENEIIHSIVMAAPGLGQSYKKTSMENSDFFKITENENRLSRIFCCDMRFPQQNITEIEECRDKIIAAKIFPGYQPLYPDTKELFPLYEFLEKKNLPLMIHSGDTYRNLAQVKYARPVFIDSIAAAFPDLKIIICHLGNPWFLEAAEIIAKNPNVSGGIDGLFTKEKNKFHNQYLNFLNKSIMDMIYFTGTVRDKFIYGSDFPVARIRETSDFTKTLDLDKEDFKDIFSQNAIRIFNLNL